MGEAQRKSPQLVTIERAMKDLPPLPTVVMKIMHLTGNDSSRAEELERTIMTDQAISTKILRVVNSPYFGMAGQVTSLSQAVLILGFDQIRNLVLSLSTGAAFEAKTQAMKEIQFELWRHALTTAACAQIVARRKKVDLKELDLVFSGGLLSNVGALFLASQFPRPYATLWQKFQQEGGRLSDFEAASFGTHHGAVGQQLGVAWKFPDQLNFMVGRHEGPFAGDPIPSLFSVHIGDCVGSSLWDTQDPLSGFARIDPLAAEWLDANEFEQRKILEETKVRLAEASDLLGSFS